MRIKEIVLCWDFGLSLIISIIAFILIPNNVTGAFVKEAYNLGITVLSIVFSIFFAALAIIMSSSDDDFVKFFEEEGDYTALLQTFKYSIFVTFIALVLSIILYMFISYQFSLDISYQQNKGFLILYFFIFSYSLFTVFNSTLDSLKYAEFRTRFLKIKK